MTRTEFVENAGSLLASLGLGSHLVWFRSLVSCTASMYDVSWMKF